jgi:hypothetical protein
MAWAPLALRRIDRSAARIGALGATISILWVVQVVPILAGRHVYFTADFPAPPWDPASYPGWWSGLNVLLPVFTSPRRVFGNPWFAVLIEVILVAVAGLVILRLCRRRQLSSLPIGSGLAVAVVALVVLAVVAPRPLPTHPLTFTGSDIGSPLVSTAQPAAGPAVPLQGIGSGTYRAAVDYAIAGAGGSGTISVYCTRGTASSPSASRVTASAALTPGTHTATLTLRCPPGTLWAQLLVGAHTQLAVRTLQIIKSGG